MAIIAGETVKLSAQFTDDDENNTSPSTPVKITVKKPGATDPDVDAVTVSEGTTGFFEYEYDTTVAGIYNYDFESADGAIEQGTFTVDVRKQ